MRDNILIMGALIWSVIGIFLLILLVYFSAPQQLEIGELENSIGKIVSVSAEVKSISYKEDTVFLTLKDSSGSIKAVFFGNPSGELVRGDEIIVKGKVQEYKGSLEIVIQELICESCR